MSESNDQKHDQQEKEKAYSALHVGDKGTDDMTLWETVWEPSTYDECIKKFVTFFENEDADEDEECDYRNAVVNLMYGRNDKENVRYLSEG